MTDAKVCLTTFVYGNAYQNYIPLLIYSIKKAYPEYYVIIFVHGKLKENIKNQLTLLKSLGDFEVRENQFMELNINTMIEAKLVRWILPYENFREFDYLYIVDIDMIYIKEPMPLHSQHIEHMNYLKLPFSNLIRNSKIINTRRRRSIINRIKKSGFKNIIDFYKAGTITYKKLTGLHFVKIHQYFDAVKEEQNKLKTMIASKSYKDDFIDSDEGFLYNIVQNSNFDLSRIGMMKNPVDMMNFKNPSRAGFRPHHGIHLGIFRTDKMVIEFEKVLQCEAYRYYIDIFKEYFNDKLFCKLIKLGSEDLQSVIKRLTKYYKIDYCK